MRLVLRLMLAIVVLLTACGQAAPSGTGATEPPQPAATPGPAQPTQAPEATRPAAAPTQPGQPAQATAVGSPASDVVITYHKSGGIAGIDETMVVHADGTIEVRGRGGTAKRAQVAASDLEPLLALVSSDEFAQLQPLYRADGADLLTYEITVTSGGTQQRVVTMDGARHPQVLGQVLTELAKLRAQVR